MEGSPNEMKKSLVPPPGAESPLIAPIERLLERAEAIRIARLLSVNDALTAISPEAFTLPFDKTGLRVMPFEEFAGARVPTTRLVVPKESGSPSRRIVTRPPWGSSPQIPCWRGGFPLGCRGFVEPGEAM
jgi:hypothetical protein